MSLAQLALRLLSSLQILMLSGVGPASHLTSLSIPVIADLPGVGSHLTDHLLVDYHFRDKTKSVLAGLSHDPRRQGRFDLLAILTRLGLMAQWALTGRGPLTTNVRLVTIDVACFLTLD